MKLKLALLTLFALFVAFALEAANLSFPTPPQDTDNVARLQQQEASAAWAIQHEPIKVVIVTPTPSATNTPTPTPTSTPTPTPTP